MQNGRIRSSLFAVATSFALLLSGCGGGGSTGSVVDSRPMPPIDVSTMILAAAPANHGLVAMDRFTVAPGASDERGNVEVSCPAGGPACVVSVADDGSVRYESTGGMPSVMSTVMDLAAAPANHGLVAMDRFTVAPGASDERGNVEVSCPAGGPACVVSVADDGSVRYESTGGVPSVMSTVMDLAAAPANHGLVAMDRFTVAPGASDERGNVEVSCPAGGPACVVSVADDGSVRYESTGGVPSVMSSVISTVMDLAAAPANHGLVAMDRFTVAPGASDERGNVEVSCPAGGPACVVSVADDGSVRYESTGGMPSVMSTVMDLAAAPANHGLVAMDRFTVAPGASDERGNVEVSCPAGGPACVVSVADDGSVRYESTGGMPSVMSTVMDLAAAPANHGLVAMDRFTVAPGASDERGNVEVSCPAGGPACVVSVADDGSVRYESTGGMPSVMSTVMDLAAAPANHGLVAMDRFTVAPGASDERGNVEVSCPAGGPACVVSVADDGSVRYESTGGMPSVMPQVLTSEKIESILNTRLANSNSMIFTDSQYLLTCQALDCPQPRDIEFGHETVGYDFSNFNFTENRRGVFLAETPIITTIGEHLGEATQTDYKALGGWMEHSFFHIETAYWSYSDGSKLNFEISSGGMATNTNPSEPPGGVATWSGIMFGVVADDPSPPDGASFINGDATITANLRSAFLDPRVGVLFSNITNENTGVAIEDMVWTDLRLENGTFSSDCNFNFCDPNIGGRFYGPNHEEVGGVFKRDGIAGAFGARRIN